MFYYRITVDQFNYTANVLCKNSYDIATQEIINPEDLLITWQAVELTFIRACHTPTTAITQLLMETMIYDTTDKPEEWVPGELVAITNPDSFGQRTVPSGDKLPYGVGHYIRTTDQTSRRPGKLVLKTDTYESDVIPYGTYWRLTTGTLVTAVAALANRLKSNEPENIYSFVNLHKRGDDPGSITGSTYRWTQKYRYPRPVLL